MATSPALYRKLQYKTLNDFEYLGLINEVPMTLIGKPTLPATNYAELPSGSRPTRARSTWPTPASARPRTCAACCTRAR
jgi:tripartite-type tricarboxylate transporter receptor subunit TctC